MGYEGLRVRASTPKKFRPGDLAPITGIYLVSHGSRHRDRHEVVIIRGELLPTCRTCKLNIAYEVVRPVSHITHDWDFSGPSNLAIQRPREQFQDFRMFARAQMQLPIKLQPALANDGGVIPGETSDLSLGGVGAVIRGDFPPRCKTETVKIGIERGRENLSLFARLRYQSGLRYGFEFINVGAAEREAVRRFLSRRRRQAAAVTG